MTKAGYDGGYGYAITVEHPDGTEAIYGHSRALLVQKGQQVKAGEVLGEVGNTGYSFGTHLHLEVHVKRRARSTRSRCLRADGVDIKLQVETVYSRPRPPPEPPVPAFCSGH